MMLAREIDDLLSLGVATLRRWLRFAESWHAWVSEDLSRYVPAAHAEIRAVEQRLVQATQGAFRTIERATSLGLALSYEDQFRRVGLQVLGAANPLEGRAGELRLAKHEAIQDASTGQLRSMDCWGD